MKPLFAIGVPEGQALLVAGLLFLLFFFGAKPLLVLFRNLGRLRRELRQGRDEFEKALYRHADKNHPSDS